MYYLQPLHIPAILYIFLQLLLDPTIPLGSSIDYNKTLNWPKDCMVIMITYRIDVNYMENWFTWGPVPDNAKER